MTAAWSTATCVCGLQKDARVLSAGDQLRDELGDERRLAGPGWPLYDGEVRRGEGSPDGSLLWLVGFLMKCVDHHRGEGRRALGMHEQFSEIIARARTVTHIGERLALALDRAPRSAAVDQQLSSVGQPLDVSALDREPKLAGTDLSDGADDCVPAGDRNPPGLVEVALVDVVADLEDHQSPIATPSRERQCVLAVGLKIGLGLKDRAPAIKQLALGSLERGLGLLGFGGRQRIDECVGALALP